MNELSEERFRSLTRLFYFDRDPESIKNDYGKALLIGSSSSYPLSILIASLLAEKTGAGYIALSSPSSVSKVIQNRMPLTEIYVPMEGEGDDFSSLGLAEKVSPFSSVLFGNGVKESGNNKLFLEQLLKTAKGTLVLDAGALAILSSSPEILKERNPSLSVVL
ncbi:MAG: NAD(P)H-hydrate dehydratase, partial [Bacilli bacterium]